MFESRSCPVPRLHYDRVQLVHGAGGLAMSQLIDRLFIDSFADPELAQRDDAAIVSCDAQKLAISTDSFVVDPIFFPGGDIGSLAINGTVNDVAVSGATPLYITVGFIIEEGFSMSELEAVVASMKCAADIAGVRIVAGDTKVVHRGKGDKIFINTTGVGVLDGPALSCHRIEVGDQLIVSGSLGDHGVAVLSRREGLAFETEVVSDCASLVDLIKVAKRAGGQQLHACRDATRGGLTAVLNEFASANHATIAVEESKIPVKNGVRAACEMLGIEPLSVANEGKLVLCVAGDAAARVLAAMRDHDLGQDAEIIGKVTSGDAARVILTTAFGTQRLLDLPVGEPLPRIC